MVYLFNDFKLSLSYPSLSFSVLNDLRSLCLQTSHTFFSSLLGSFIDGARLFREPVWEICTVPHWCDSGRNSGWKTRGEAEDDSSPDRPKYGKKLSLLAKRNSSLKSFQKGSKDFRWVRSNLAGYWQGRLNTSFHDHEQDKILGSICPNQYGGPYNSHRSEIWGPRICDQNWLSWGCVEYMGWPRYFRVTR